MELAQMLGEELPEHRSFEYTYRAVEGRMAFLEWAYEDANVRVRTGRLLPDRGGKIVAVFRIVPFSIAPFSSDKSPLADCQAYGYRRHPCRRVLPPRQPGKIAAIRLPRTP